MVMDDEVELATDSVSAHASENLIVCVCVQNALQFIKQCWKMQGRPLFLVLIREDNIK